MLITNWDELRKQARILENEIDSKLAAFGKLNPRFSSQSSVPHFGTTTKINDSTPLNQRDEFTTVFQSMCNDIEHLLQKLTQVNDQMATFVPESETFQSSQSAFDSQSTGGTLPGSNVATIAAGRLSQLHTAKRHREILRDYAREFRQTRMKLLTTREREDLLGSVYHEVNAREDLKIYGPSGLVTDTNTNTFDPKSEIDMSGGNHRLGAQSPVPSSTRLLLDEQEKYHRSNRLMDENLAAASTIRAALRAQRFALRTASNGLLSLSSRFPRVKKLIGKIDWRHRQDSIILGVVIGCCIVFLLIYKFG